jgi:hypothetical protein
MNAKDEHLAAHMRLGTHCILYDNWWSKERDRMKTLVIQTMALTDLNGERLAEFWVMTDPEETVQPWVKVVAMFGMHEMYRTNVSNPVALQSGMIMPMQSFLGWLMQVMRYSRNNQWAYELQSDNPYKRIMIIEPISVKELAEVTQFPEELIRSYFSNMFILKKD